MDIRKDGPSYIELVPTYVEPELDFGRVDGLRHLVVLVAGLQHCLVFAGTEAWVSQYSARSKTAAGTAVTSRFLLPEVSSSWAQSRLDFFLHVAVDSSSGSIALERSRLHI